MTEVIAFHYTVKNAQGEALDSSAGGEPFAVMVGKGHILPKLEEILLTLQQGEKKTVPLAAADAYGERDETLVVEVERNMLPEELEVGQLFSVSRGNGQQGIAKVVSFDAEKVVMDNNHPLAGEELTFDVELVGRREATAEENAHGHAHGADGSHSH